MKLRDINWPMLIAYVTLSAFSYELPWWRWLGVVLTGVLIGVLGYRDHQHRVRR